MKVLTAKQPWASLIVEGIKPIENRTWKCPEKYIGQRVLIHAAAKSWLWHKVIQYITEPMADILISLGANITWLENLPKGAIIGSVEIVDCVINHPSIWAERHSPPFKPYNWVLANPIKFPQPIPAKGKLGFWDHATFCEYEKAVNSCDGCYNEDLGGVKHYYLSCVECDRLKTEIREKLSLHCPHCGIQSSSLKEQVEHVKKYHSK